MENIMPVSLCNFINYGKKNLGSMQREKYHYSE